MAIGVISRLEFESDAIRHSASNGFALSKNICSGELVEIETRLLPPRRVKVK